MKFWVTDTSGSGGPSIFGRRLSHELERQGHIRQRIFPRLQIGIARLRWEPAETKLLRLDGLYLDAPWDSESQRRNFILRRNYLAADDIVFQSNYSRLQYESWFGQRSNCRVIHNGISFDSIPHGLRRSADLVCASAEWRPNKRLVDTIRVFRHPRLAKAARLRIMGHIPKSEAIRIGSLPDNVEIVGLKPEDQVLRECSTASAFVHFAWLDWCPNSVVEALACGAPVVCTSSGGTKELVGSDGLIVDVGDDVQPGRPVMHRIPPPLPIGDMAEAVLRLLENPRPVSRPDLNLSTVSRQYVGSLEAPSEKE